jgi:NAD(P)-dependent dehydrogenase (short-subunit alcohol dehydrogenase family)
LEAKQVMTRKIMLLTGGSRGIGLGIACEAVRRGWFVSLGLRNADTLPEGLTPDAAEVVGYDATAGGEQDWVAGVMDRHGRIDAVVACAGLLEHDSIVTGDDAKVLRLFEVNAHAPPAWLPRRGNRSSTAERDASSSWLRSRASG